MHQRPGVERLHRPVRPFGDEIDAAEVLEVAARAVGHPDRLGQAFVEVADVAAEQAAGEEGEGGVFGTGLVRLPQMMKAGFWLNLAGILVITALVAFFFALKQG